MLNFRDASLRRGTRILFEGLTFTLAAGQKLGVTGANGCGKSSLFALIQGELSLDSGDFSLPPRLTLAHVAQETPALHQSAIDYVLDGDQVLRQVERQLASAEEIDDGIRQARLHAEYEAIEGYTARSRAARLLHGLGFQPGQETTPICHFSGGWRMRLNLAQALMCRSDLLLLDEPTNHLDLETTLWLEEWLRQYPGTLLLISHDREFLDRIVTAVLHFANQQGRLYIGNYSAFERQRAEQLAQQQAAYTRQQREIVAIERFVTRFRAKASKARQAQSRLKALERMEVIAQAHVDSPFQFQFRSPEKLPHTLLRLDKVALGYGDATVLRNVNVRLSAGDRIGLLGQNGAGKSTLVKALAGALTPQQGDYTPAQDLNVGYFAQHQLEQLHPTLTPLQHLQQLDVKASEQSLRNFLGGFGFGGERADGNVTYFSGGERARLVLAMLVYQRPNVLLLDEPTNHLDLDMRHALTLALQDFEGAIVVIAHDRYLLQTVADDFLLVANGQVQPFSGDLEDYRQWVIQQNREDNNSSTATTSEQSAVVKRDRKRVEAEQRQRSSPLRNQLKQLEKLLERQHSEQQSITQQLAEPALYGDNLKDRLKFLLAEQARLAREIAQTEDRWMHVSTELEAMEQG